MTFEGERVKKRLVGRFVLKPGADELIRRIFKLVRDGYGVEAVAKLLNREGVPHFATGTKTGKREGRQGQHWTTNYVASLVRSRAVVGEYQPMSGSWRTGRKLAGDPIPRYYPAVLSDDEWHATQAVVRGRRRTPGRKGKRVNIFLGLMNDARTKTAMRVNSKGKRPATLYPAAYALGKSNYVSFPYNVFESSILSCLRELDPREILNPKDDTSSKLLAITGRIGKLEGKIERLK